MTLTRPEPWHPRGLTLIETVVSLVLITVLLSILLPALYSARVSGYRDQCQANQRLIGRAVQDYLHDHNGQFPYVPVRPGWFYGGVRFSSADGAAFPDLDRPLTPYLGLHRTTDMHDIACCCPADRGITDARSEVAASHLTVFRANGTSYQANAPVFHAPHTTEHTTPRGMRRAEIITAPSRLLLLGDPVWHEVSEGTGAQADWHGQPSMGNFLFLDLSVRFLAVKPRSDRNQAIVFEPEVRTDVAPLGELRVPNAEAGTRDGTKPDASSSNAPSSPHM